MSTKNRNRIESEEQLRQELGTDSLSEIYSNPEVFNRMVALVRKMTPEELRAMLLAIPALVESLSKAIGTIGEISASLEETKRHRWSVLQALAESGTLSADQVLEAMKIIAEIEEKERLDLTSIIGKIVEGLGYIAIAGLAVIMALSRNRK